MDIKEKINNLYNHYVDGEITREEYESTKIHLNCMPIMEAYLNDECDYNAYLYKYFSEDSSADIVDMRSNTKIYIDNFKKNHRGIKRKIKEVESYIKKGDVDNATKLIDETTEILNEMIKEVRSIPNNEFLLIGRTLIDAYEITNDVLSNSTANMIHTALHKLGSSLIQNGLTEQGVMLKIVPKDKIKKIGKAIDIANVIPKIYYFFDRKKRVDNGGDVGSIKMLVLTSMKNSVLALKKYKVVIAKSMNDINKLSEAKKELKDAKKDRNYHFNRIVSG